MAKDPYRYFRIEAREILDGLSRGVLAHEKGAPRLRGEGTAGEGDVERLLRLAHTLKGAAGVVGQAATMQLAHRLEGLLTERAPADALLAVVDAIEAELAKLNVPLPRPVTSEAVPEPVRPEAESVRLDLAEVDHLLASVADVGSRLGLARAAATSLERVEDGATKIEDWLQQAKQRPDAVDWEEAHTLLATLRLELRTERRSLTTALEGAARRSGEALEDARRLRLLPASALASELTRAARDGAMSAGRQVELTTNGEDLRVDAQVLSALRDALLQLVRNAIAHGIESPADRARAGKPAAGRITIRFGREGARAVVACHDDGRGIDVEGVRHALVARGLVSKSEANALDASGLMGVAFQRGVTTRGSASELAGRGVGLQLVGSVIAELRGEIDVRTEAGKGTELTLTVPVSMTAAPALLVAVGDVVATLPLDSVVRTLRIQTKAIATSPEGDALDPGAGEAAVRFAPLNRVLSLVDFAGPRDMWTVVLLEAGGQRAAIGIDRVVGVANEVVRPLPPGAVASSVVLGAALDGKGEPRLALDPRAVVDAVCKLAGSPRAAPRPSPKSVLVVDDSLTSRMLEQSILEAAGYDVTTAVSGEAALAIAKTRQFDLFVFDVEMPGMTGFELVAKTRADPALAGTPAVLVTSRATAEDKRRGLEAGARAYIVKGEFAQDEFLDAVRRLSG